MMKKLSVLQWIFAVLGLFMAISCFASGGTGIIGGLIVLLSAIWVSPIMGKIPMFANSGKSPSVLSAHRSICASFDRHYDLAEQQY